MFDVRPSKTVVARVLPYEVASLIIAIDQTSKAIALARLSKAPISLLGGVLSLELLRNRGAAFGLFSNEYLLIGAFAVASLLALMYMSKRVSSTYHGILLGVLGGGVSGNLVDRIFRGDSPLSGSAVDWIHLSFYPAVFNLADVAIRVSLLLWLVDSTLRFLRTRHSLLL